MSPFANEFIPLLAGRAPLAPGWFIGTGGGSRRRCVDGRDSLRGAGRGILLVSITESSLLAKLNLIGLPSRCMAPSFWPSGMVYIGAIRWETSPTVQTER
jgi:hypothetical protein